MGGLRSGHGWSVIAYVRLNWVNLKGKKRGWNMATSSSSLSLGLPMLALSFFSYSLPFFVLAIVYGLRFGGLSALRVYGSV
jgi:hypothetical protein